MIILCPTSEVSTVLPPYPHRKGKGWEIKGQSSAEGHWDPYALPRPGGDQPPSCPAPQLTCRIQPPGRAHGAGVPALNPGVISQGYFWLPHISPFSTALKTSSVSCSQYRITPKEGITVLLLYVVGTPQISVDKWAYITGTSWRLSDAMAGLCSDVFWSRRCFQSGPLSRHLGTHLRIPMSTPPFPPACVFQGFHTYQRMIGCELLEDGNTTGFLQHAYDGQDFIIFSKDTLPWMAMDNVAHITKQAWEASQHELQYQKNWLEEECIAWLKRFLEHGKGTLQRTGKEEGEHLVPISSEPMVLYVTSSHLSYSDPILKSILLLSWSVTLHENLP